jgi:mono/diheme cytochrome c family protein
MDPIVSGTAYSNQPPHPDRPGQLPVLTFARLQELPTLDPVAFPRQSFNDWITASVKNPAELGADDRRALNATLEEMFGTPLAPKVDGADKDYAEKLRAQLKLAPEMLREGSRLYRQHCLHCHGLTGDGRGPTAFWINPHPRDYRKGQYKFVSTAQPQGGEQRPRREDILRTIRYGLDGTAMPAFNVLPDKDIEAIASYVIHLGLRGEVEEDAIIKMLAQKPADREWEAKDYIQGGLRVYGERWLKSQRELEPDPYPYTSEQEFAASVKRGWDIFRRDEKEGGGACLNCHLDYGRRVPFRFDDWGTMVRPADLTTGIYRGGRRPIDLYWRIHNGIVGSGMKQSQSLAWTPEQTKAQPQPKEQKIWDLVNFLQVLPYPQMRKQYEIRID